LEETDWQTTLKLALQLLEAGDFQQRWEIAKFFPKLGEKAVAPLLEILEDETADLELRWFVGRILSEFAQPRTIVALARLIGQTEAEELSLMASQSLAQMGKAGIKALQELLAAEESRLLAVQALAQIRHSDTIEPLLTVINDPQPQIRATAIEALGSFPDPALFPVLLQALQDSAAQVRKEAVIALGIRLGSYGYPSLSDLDFVAIFKPLLYDFKPEVCQQAAIALGRVGTDEAAAALLPVLKSTATPLWLKLDIVRALSWIETVRALECLEEGLGWSDAPVCQEIVRILGRVRKEELKKKATQILREFVNSGQQSLQQPQLKQAVALSLGELGERESLDILRSLAEDREAAVRLHAIAALKKFS
jgi:HEAT repeat protein